MQKRRGLSWSFLLVLALVAGVGLIGARLTAGAWWPMVDTEATRQVAYRLHHVEQRDGLAYPFHAAMGTLFSRTPLSPAVAGLHWMKAAAHARSDAELQMAAAGIEAARERESPQGELEANLCASLARGAVNSRQVAALARTDLPCAATARAAQP